MVMREDSDDNVLKTALSASALPQPPTISPSPPFLPLSTLPSSSSSIAPSSPSSVPSLPPYDRSNVSHLAWARTSFELWKLTDHFISSLAWFDSQKFDHSLYHAFLCATELHQQALLYHSTLQPYDSSTTGTGRATHDELARYRIPLTTSTLPPSFKVEALMAAAKDCTARQDALITLEERVNDARDSVRSLLIRGAEGSPVQQARITLSIHTTTLVGFLSAIAAAPSLAQSSPPGSCQPALPISAFCSLQNATAEYDSNDTAHGVGDQVADDSSRVNGSLTIGCSSTPITSDCESLPTSVLTSVLVSVSTSSASRTDAALTLPLHLPPSSASPSHQATMARIGSSMDTPHLPVPVATSALTDATIEEADGHSSSTQLSSAAEPVSRDASETACETDSASDFPTIPQLTSTTPSSPTFTSLSGPVCWADDDSSEIGFPNTAAVNDSDQSGHPVSAASDGTQEQPTEKSSAWRRDRSSEPSHLSAVGEHGGRLEPGSTVRASQRSYHSYQASFDIVLGRVHAAWVQSRRLVWVQRAQSRLRAVWTSEQALSSSADIALERVRAALLVIHAPPLQLRLPHSTPNPSKLALPPTPPAFQRFCSCFRSLQPMFSARSDPCGHSLEIHSSLRHIRNTRILTA